MLPTVDIVIREAGPGDMETLVSLLGQLFALEADFTVDPEAQRRGLALFLDGCGKHRTLKVAEVAGRVKGMVSAQMVVSTAEGGFAALVEDLVVKKEWQGRGIGQALLEAVGDWSKARGIRRLQLLADRENPPALAFYARLGWTSTRLICLRRMAGRDVDRS